MALSSKMEKADQGTPGDTNTHDNDVSKQETVSELDLCSQNLADLNNKLLKEHHAVTTLKLNFNNLSALPDGLAQCVPNLKVLHANGNSLTCLPGDFGSLTSLTDVELKENELTCLPDSVQYLANLQRLQLTGNQITSLPEDFGEMVLLEKLFIDENLLTKLPPTFALLDRLRILEAGHNRLRVLPKHFGNLRSLTHFSICNNKLERMPESFYELEHLVILDVSGNSFRTLPEECSSQKTLEKVFAGCNNLMTVPYWLGHLPEVTELCLKQNVIGRGLPDDFGKVCKKLRRLDLRGNNVTWLPDSFGELESLEWVHFGSALDLPERRADCANGNWLFSLPASFPQLAQLTTLRLDENHLQSLPEEFGCLCSLEYLDLGHNMLHDLPESFGNLGKLHVCILSMNGLQLLPSTFGQLSALEEVRLDFNELAELPKSFRNLTQLKILDLFENQLTELPDFLDQFVSLKVMDLGRNRFKMPRSQVPSISREVGYMPRSEYPQRTWRGIMVKGLVGHRLLLRRREAEESDEETRDEADNPRVSEYSPNNIHFKGSLEDVHLASSDRDESRQNEAGFDWGGGYEKTADDDDDDDDGGGESGNDFDDDPCQASDTDSKHSAEQGSWGTGSQDESVQASTSPPYTPAVPEEENWDEDENVQASPVPVYAATVPEEENWDEDENVQASTVPPYTPTGPEEENWDEDCDGCSTPYQSSYIPPSNFNLPRVTYRRSSFYLCASEHHMPNIRKREMSAAYQEPVEGQFSDADDGTAVSSDASAQTNTDSDNTQTSTDADNTQTDSGDTAVSHAHENSPTTTNGSQSVVSPWAAYDLHPPKIVRPKYDDPDYKEPQPDAGQFWNW